MEFGPFRDVDTSVLVVVMVNNLVLCKQTYRQVESDFQSLIFTIVSVI